MKDLLLLLGVNSYQGGLKYCPPFSIGRMKKERVKKMRREIGITFTSFEHSTNFIKIKEKYPQVKKASDYRAACYILALPDVFIHVGDLDQLEWLFSWCYDYETVEVEEHDDWDYSKDGRYYRRDIHEDDQGNMITGQRFAGLSGGARRLVLAAMSLYNGTKGFDLDDGICSWGDRLFQVFISACILRKGGILDGKAQEAFQKGDLT